MTDMDFYILQGLCNGNCYHCILPCEDRDKPIICYTPKEIQDEDDDIFIMADELDSIIDKFLLKI